MEKEIKTNELTKLEDNKRNFSTIKLRCKDLISAFSFNEAKTSPAKLKLRQALILMYIFYMAMSLE